MTTRIRTRVGQETAQFMTEKLIKEQQGDANTQPHEVVSLRFSFKQLSCISPLTGFSALTELLLDNNDITKIENLACVPNLTRLDLSFNQIEAIEGLSTLTKLVDLSLYSNKITVIRNLDALTNLQCLSIGKNQLSDLDATARTLRTLPALRLVTLSHNPLAAFPDYETRILGFCQKLRYLDGVRISAAAVEAAMAACSEELIVVGESDRRAAETAAAAAAAEGDRDRVAALGLPGVGTLFDHLIQDDGDARLILAFCEHGEFSGVREAVDRYKGRIAETVDEMVRRATTNKAKVEKETEMFAVAMAQARAAANTSSRDILLGYEKEKSRLERRLALPPSDPSRGAINIGDEVVTLRNRLANVKGSLLEIEVDLSEGIQRAHETAARRLAALTELATESMASGFGKLRDEENEFHKELNEVFSRIVEQRASEASARRNDAGGVQQLIDVRASPFGGLAAADTDNDALKQLYVVIDNRDELMKVTHEAHDARLQKLFVKEEVCVSGYTATHDALMNKLREEEHARHRAKVCEINLYVSLLMQDVASVGGAN